MIGRGAMLRTMSCVNAPLAERPEEDIGALHRLVQRAELGFHRMGGFPLVEVRAAAMDDALGVAGNDVLALHAEREQKIDAGDARRTRAVDHELQTVARSRFVR